MHPNVIHNPPTSRGFALSLVLHLAVGLVVGLTVDHEDKKPDLVDIEIAPPPPPVEALPEEVARRPEASPATPPTEAAGMPPAAPSGELAVDAGVPDAPPDAAPKKRKRPDAGIDAGEPMVAEGDAGLGDAGETVASDDAGTSDATMIAAAEGSGSGAGDGSGGRGSNDAVGSGSAGATNEPAVEGAPTTAGTAANLLSYFPAGHLVTALIRFDRLRGTEWAQPTERLLRPMPDYQILFGPNDAEIGNKIDTLVISSPAPKDATATTLVAHTKMPRDKLREFLGATSPVAWSASKGGLLGKRTGKLFPNDKRIFLSPFKEWFLLAQPSDIAALTAPSAGDLDTIEAKGKLPPWLAGIRTIEAESGDPRGPALVLTVALGGQTVPLGDDLALGIKSVTLPDRVSLAMELVKQGWLVRGNMSFTTPEAAGDFITAAEAAQKRVADNRGLQLAMGKPVARVIANLHFARSGPRVSYTTSISIADARTILAAAATQLDAYFVAPP